MDNAARELITLINEAMAAACPPTYTTSTLKRPPWMTREVNEARVGIKHKLKRAKESKSKSNRDVYHSELKKYKKLLSNSKNKSWKEFCKNTESTSDISRVNKILKITGSKPAKLDTAYKNKDTKTLSASPEETLDVMIKYHFTSVSADAIPDTSQQEYENQSTNDTINKIVNEDRLGKVINDMDPLKAAGPDQVQSILIQKAYKLIKKPLLETYRQSHKKGYIPKPWQETTSIFLPKPGKVDYNDAKSFRTITLSSNFLKIHKKIIIWYIEHDLGLDRALNKKQYGFRKGCSTEAALHKLVHMIERRIAKKGFVLGTFLDIEGAFDNISFSAIKKTIEKSKVDSVTCNWIFKMISNRFTTITFRNITKRFKITKGCPQGGILFPFLWNLVVNSLLEKQTNKILGYLQAFADNLVILAEGNDLEVIQDRIQKSINTINKWCKNNGLNISSLKTKVIMFTWRRKWELPSSLHLDCKPLKLDKATKFLGVHLDSKLNFNEHIKHIAKKATTSLMQCRKAVGPTWGLTLKSC